MRATVFVVFLQPVEREPLIYHLDASSSRHHQAFDNLPDEFFEVTVDDIRKRFAQLKSERCVWTRVCIYLSVCVCVDQRANEPGLHVLHSSGCLQLTTCSRFAASRRLNVRS